MTHPNSYIGRFAPSPTGPLHLGSLVAALASYLDAKANDGLWLVRMEDIDRPREQPGAASLILKTLEIYGLRWDDTVIYQSHRDEAYREALEKLQQQDLLYPCTCSRKKLTGYKGRYPGFCRYRFHTPEIPYSLRLRTPPKTMTCEDRIQGRQSFPLDEIGDSILLRKDGLFAYQLAVVVDDAEQEVTNVVRGCDLLDSTPRQQYILQLLNHNEPAYAHLPVIMNDCGDKLSKQNHATALPMNNPAPMLFKALKALHQPLPPVEPDCDDIEALLNWSVQHWDLTAIPAVMGIPQQDN